MTDYKPLPSLTEIDPDIEVFEFNILVLPRELEEKTASGVYMPETSREREDEAGIEGMIVATGEFAFHWEDPSGEVLPWRNTPQPGDVAMFARYAGGRNFVGKDGRKYRIMKDKEILGVRRQAASPVSLPINGPLPNVHGATEVDVKRALDRDAQVTS